MKNKFIKKIKKYIAPIIITLVIFAVGVFVGDKITYKPSVYGRYCTDPKTGVQYIIAVSKDGGIAIFPRLNDDGSLYSKNNNDKFVFIVNQ